MTKLAVTVSSSNGLDYLLMLQRYIATVLENNPQFSRFTGYRCRVRPSGDRRTPATWRGCPRPASCTSAARLLLRPEERPERKPVQYGLGLLDRPLIGAPVLPASSRARRLAVPFLWNVTASELRRAAESDNGEG
jgi:hypothetical protein